MDTLSFWTLLLAIATFILAIAAFLAIFQNYIFRRADRNRDSIIRSTEDLFSWMEESLRLFYLPYNYNKDEIYFGLIRMVSKSTDSTAAAIIVGTEFIGLVRRATYALTNYLSAIKARRQQKLINDSILEEYSTSFEGLHFYLNLLRSWDYKYSAFLKEAKKHSKLPLSENISAIQIIEEATKLKSKDLS